MGMSLSIPFYPYKRKALTSVCSEKKRSKNTDCNRRQQKTFRLKGPNFRAGGNTLQNVCGVVNTR